jgi:hypothetical protein
MPEELEPPFATADAVAKGAAAVVEQFGENGRHYLQTIAKYNAAGWPDIERVIVALPPATPAP